MSLAPLSSVVKRITRLRPFPLLVRRKGVSLLLDPRNWIDNRFAAWVPYEEAQIARATDLIRREKIDTLIDVGANIGIYTVLVGRLPEVRRILAFEPVRRNFNQLLGNVFANRLDSKVDAHRVALGKAPEQGNIHIDPRSTGVSRLDFADCRRPRSVFREEEEVEILRFDDVAKLDDHRIFLKIDVEGKAHDALLGMERLFRNNYVLLQVEIAGGESEAVRDLLTRYGMEFTESIGGDFYFSPRKT
jgi:FkbM family methyltransferase